KTNSSNKDASEACQIAFLSAVKSLQDRAVREGGNAVVNIHSFYNKIPEWSDTTYHCEDGHLMSGVALRGTVIKK
ncbi:MAG: excinuclease ABC subunit A, partial [Alphaproteobacteria bacterium]|nr:excinuclease ABC subunit A [Alphaproteobacteria bacterium]